MRESIGSTFLYNMIIVYIIIVIGLLTATVNYYKGYKINTRILNSINKYAGYNSLSKNEIENYLSGIGYLSSPDGQNECPVRNGLEPISARSIGAGDTNYLYCIYYFDNDNSSKEIDLKNKDNEYAYYNYGVVSYIYVDLPIVNKFKVPVYTKGERIYNFSDTQSQLGV